MAAMISGVYQSSCMRDVSFPMVAITVFCALVLALATEGGFVAPTNGRKETAQGAASDPSATVQTVTLDLFAADGKGNPITDLTSEQLRLEEDGVEQKITDLERGDSVPLVIAVFFDTSLSRRSDPFLREEAAAAREFLRRIWRSGDLAAVFAFSDQLQFVAEPTEDLQTVLTGLGSLPNAKYKGGTALYDALCIFKPEKLAAINGRKVFVVFSDFIDNASTNSLDKTIAYAWSTNVRIFPVLLYEESGPLPNKEHNRNGTETAERLADASGGRVFEPKSSGDVRKAFQNLAKVVENSYLVSYTPTPAPSPNKKRTIKIKSLRQDAQKLSFPQGR
jgi:Ca-activated chloride channel family protein